MIQFTAVTTYEERKNAEHIFAEDHEDREGRGASQEVGLEGREADQKVDQKRNRNEGHEVVRAVEQRRNLRKLEDQDPLRRPRLILQHPEARKRKRRSRGQGALRKGRGGRNEQLQP